MLYSINYKFSVKNGASINNISHDVDVISLPRRDHDNMINIYIIYNIYNFFLINIDSYCTHVRDL